MKEWPERLDPSAPGFWTSIILYVCYTSSAPRPFNVLPRVSLTSAPHLCTYLPLIPFLYTSLSLTLYLNLFAYFLSSFIIFSLSPISTTLSLCPISFHLTANTTLRVVQVLFATVYGMIMKLFFPELVSHQSELLRGLETSCPLITSKSIRLTT